MALQHEIRDFLLSFSAIAAVLGDRVYPVAMPQGAIKPALAWRIANRSYQGEDLDSADLTDVSLEFVIWGGTYEQADEAADAIRDTLRSWAASGDPLTIGDLSPYTVGLQGEQDIFDEELFFYGRQQTWDFSGVNL
jgi:hypothetical protein